MFKDTSESLLDKEEIKVIRPSGDFEILVLKDIDKKPVHIGVKSVSSEREKIFLDIYSGGNWTERFVDIDPKHKKLLEIATARYKIPFPLSAYFIFDMNGDLRELPIPEENSTTPILVAVGGDTSAVKGMPGVGKSTLSAILSLRNNWPIFDFENFYEENASLHAKILVEGGWNPKTDSFQNAIDILDRKLTKNIKNSFLKGVKPIRNCLDEAVNYFKQTSSRSDVYICDMPGSPRKNIKVDGNIESLGRSHDIYDLFFRESPDLSFFTNRRLSFEQMERKLDWMEKIIKEKINSKNGKY